VPQMALHLVALLALLPSPRHCLPIFHIAYVRPNLGPPTL
jgi:hypothetical protein